MLVQPVWFGWHENKITSSSSRKRGQDVKLRSRGSFSISEMGIKAQCNGPVNLTGGQSQESWSIVVSHSWLPCGYRLVIPPSCLFVFMSENVEDDIKNICRYLLILTIVTFWKIQMYLETLNLFNYLVCTLEILVFTTITFRKQVYTVINFIKRAAWAFLSNTENKSYTFLGTGPWSPLCGDG